jgi:hypothetical protein
MYGGGFSPTFNFDGVMAYSRTGQTGQGYLQLFRDGKVECVETRGSGFNEYNQPILRSLLIEGACIGCTRRMFDLFRTLAVEPPCAVMLTLIGVKGHFLTVDPTRFDNYAIDRNTLIITPEVAENYDSDSAAILMRPMFDALWNATGLSQCGDYDASGQPTQELETVIQRMG